MTAALALVGALLVLINLRFYVFLVSRLGGLCGLAAISVPSALLHLQWAVVHGGLYSVASAKAQGRKDQRWTSSLNMSNKRQSQCRNPQKQLLIGLDAAEWDLIRRWAGEESFQRSSD